MIDNPSQITRGFRLVSALILVVMIALGIWTLFQVSSVRAYQVDEVEHLHAAYNLQIGKLPYHDFYQVHPPLLHILLYPLTDPDDPESSYIRGRYFALVVLLFTLLFCAGCASRLSNPLGGVIALGLALSHTTLIERGMEIRPDNVVNLLAMLALYLELRADKPSVRRYMVQGFVLGVGLLLAQKTAFPSFAFGCLWLFAAIRFRKPWWVILPVCVWAIPALIATAALLYMGTLNEAFVSIFGGAYDAASGAEHRDTFSPWKYIESESRRNVTFLIFGIAGTLRGLLDLLAPSKWLYAQRSPFPISAARPFAFPAFFTLIMIASLWLNPFPWPYVHPAPALALAMMGGALIGGILVQRFKSPTAWQAMLGASLALAMAALISAPRLIEKSEHRGDPNSTGYQLFIIKELSRITKPDDAVFDLVGFYFRPDAYPAYSLSKDLVGWYKDGAYPRMIPTLRQNETVAFVHTYRKKWLPAEEREFLRTHFIRYFANIYILGTDVSNCEPGKDYYFEVLKTKPFRYEGSGEMTINGQPFTHGILGKGRHIVQVRDQGTGRLIMDTPSPKPAFPLDKIPGPGNLFRTPVEEDKYRVFD